MADSVLELDSSRFDQGAAVSSHRLPTGYEAFCSQPAGDSANHNAVGQASDFIGGGLRCRRRVVILKSKCRDKLLAAGVQDPEKLATGPLFVGWIEGGRTRHSLIRTGGEEWVLKTYRRGGVIGGWNSQRYWGYQRFLNELHLAATAESRGVSTAEVLALVFAPAGFGSVRSWIVTRYLPGVRPLHEFYGHSEASSVFHAAGLAVVRMHRAGIDHSDLHTGNIVGAIDAAGTRAFILDWDRARCRADGSWNPHGNLVRLWRSVEKGRKKGLFGDPSTTDLDTPLLRRSLRAFIRGYFAGKPRALSEAREYFRRRALWLGVRTIFSRGGARFSRSGARFSRSEASLSRDGAGAPNGGTDSSDRGGSHP